MRGFCIVLVFAGLVVMMSACQSYQPRNAANIPEVEPTPVVKANTAFATDLYANVREEKGNLIFSPINVSAALMMAHVGARGETEKELAGLLHLPAQSKDIHREFGELHRGLRTRWGVKLNFANALWLHRGVGIADGYRKTLTKDYGAELNRVDFVSGRAAARRAINQWGSKHTNGRIKNSLPPGSINAWTRMVLSSAIYFKGTWRTRFQKSRTYDAPFYVTKDKSVTVPMMKTKEALFRTAHTKNVHAVELPYTGGVLSMLIILPKEEVGLDAVEKSMTPENLKRLIGELYESETKVFLPRFDVKSQFELASPLIKMGASRMFSGDADFSGIGTGINPLFVQGVVHSAFIIVDEDGTEAGGITHISYGLSASMMSEFRVDRPFLYLIRDRKTGSILFMGRVVNPLEN